MVQGDTHAIIYYNIQADGKLKSKAKTKNSRYATVHKLSPGWNHYYKLLRSSSLTFVR